MRRCWLALGLLCLLASQSTALGSDAGGLPEYELKAGFLYNFAKYVEWPADAFATLDTPISIGIVGSDPFGPDLDRILRDKTAQNRRFEIRRYPGLAELEPVHILFVPHTESARLAGILKRVERLPVLTVGEDEGFPECGGVVAILIEQQRPRLQINPQAAGAQRLAIAAKLLRIATLVETSN